MFNAQATGLYIALMRKRLGMTQCQLAEKVGVSPQAVSNWERGLAAPDISILSVLAVALRTSVDGILAAGNQRAQNEDAAEEITGPDEKSDRADKTEAQPEVTEKMESDETWNRPDLEITDIPDFRDLSKKIEQSVRNALSGLNVKINNEPDEGGCPENEKPNEEHDESPDAPYKKKNIPDIEKIIDFAPFTRTDTLKKLIDKHMGDLTPYDVGRLAPFLNGSYLDKLIAREFEPDVEANWEFIESVAPFAGKETLDRLVMELISNGEETDMMRIHDIAPFLSKSTLDRLVSVYEVKGNIDDIVELAPFLSKDTIDRILDVD